MLDRIIWTFNWGIVWPGDLLLLHKNKINKTLASFECLILLSVADLEGGVRGVRPPPKIRKVYVMQR
jgi:hypothetical protein